jgi:hypothetical protein
LKGNQTFGQGDQSERGSIGPPRNAANIGKCISIKEEVWSRSVEASQKLKGFEEGSRI